MTEAINSAITLSKYQEEDALDLTLGAATTLNKFESVYLTGNKIVSRRSAGTQFPIGIVLVTPTAAGADVTVRTCFTIDLKGTNKNGSAVAAGAFMKQNNNVGLDGKLEYVSAATGDYADAIVLSGGAADAEIILGILRVPVKI